MSAAIERINALSAGWFDALLAVTWQSTLLVAIIAILLQLLKNLPPAARCWVWRIVALKLLVMPFWALPISVPTTEGIQPAIRVAANSPATAFESLSSATAEPALTSDPLGRAPSRNSSQPISTTPSISWQSALLMLWAVVVAAQLVRLIAQHIALIHLLRTTVPASPPILELASTCCQELGLAQVPPTRVTPAEVSPFVCSMFQPQLVLPETLVAHASPVELRAIVLHEVAHIRRRDLPWCLLLQLVRIVWWFHPLARWVAYRESLERELACDQLAMSHANITASDYARTLVDAASRIAFPSVLRAAAAASLDGGQSLVRSSETRPFARRLDS